MPVVLVGRGRGAEIEATVLRASHDVTFKLLSGKLLGERGDIVLHACEVSARSCPATSDDRLLLHFDRFRRLDAYDPANQPPSPRAGADDVEQPPTGPRTARRVRGLGTGSRKREPSRATSSSWVSAEAPHTVQQQRPNCGLMRCSLPRTTRCTLPGTLRAPMLTLGPSEI